MRIIKSWVLFALVLLFCCTTPPTAEARDITCDFYDVTDVPDDWQVSMSPGFNNQEQHSIGHYYNREKNASVLIQIGKSDFGHDLEATARQLVESLKGNGATILSGPAPDGPLMRLEATLTGTPATMWVGSNGELTCLTVISGNRDECRNFLALVRNADPLLIPQASKVLPQ